MKNKGLLFIPDISGFTRFVSETEIEHSRMIIQELLETLINANAIGLDISEIEGDAILFYKFGDAPDLHKLYKQVEKMFQVFHQSLMAYDMHRYCQCQACMSAINLSLKVITHYGEFTDYNVKNFNKLIGKDVIIAHQLLKNDIHHNEYWLVTKNLVQHTPPKELSWIKWNGGVKETESGKIDFQYAELTQLKNELPIESKVDLELSEKVKVISLSKEYHTDIITLFHATGDFRYRNRWRVGVKHVEALSHLLPRVGMACRCVFDNGKETILYSSSYSFRPDRIQFSETDEKKKETTQYVLERIDVKRTRLTLHYCIAKRPLVQFVFGLTAKRAVEKSIEESLENLIPLTQELRIPTALKE